MEQKTQSWHEWRNKGLGASDAPIVMDVSPWTTPYQLWEYKTGRAVRSDGNWATQRGNDMEPRARASLELKLNMDFPAVLMEHAEFPFMRASLDGWNAENRIVLEIKCPGKEDHDKAANGQIPEKYYPQLQHQLFVSGASFAYYYSYSEDENKVATGYLVQVTNDIDYQKKLFDKMLKFWKCVQEDKEPVLTDKDYKTIRNDDVRSLLYAWLETKKNIDILEKRLENLKIDILNHTDVKDRRVKCDNFRIGITSRKGSIQYSKIPELQNVDLERYRGDTTSYQTISFKEPK